ncbi:uncharacterized protein LOC134240237 [Saccostrea cucullata]|uniref:uncharacterized protein LOC134240237 n=1 Tax=Saccostrea cuccullata TaxID=36930 RepID=UPI002ED484D4
MSTISSSLRPRTLWIGKKRTKSILVIFAVGTACGLYISTFMNASRQPFGKSVKFKYEGRSLLTMFSTWPTPEYPEKYDVRNNTVANWIKFKEFFTPIYFTNDENLKHAVEKGGWKTLPVTKVGSGNDLPVFKNLFLDAMKHYDSWFYGFASGDIMFTEGLIKTLLALIRIPEFRDKVILLVGQRTNVDNVTMEEATNFETLKKISKDRGQLWTPLAEDYFITSKNFPWGELLDVVSGRCGMDNFIVMESLDRGYIVIETTQTILAVHHTSVGGNNENLRKPNANYNMDLIKKFYGRKPYNYSKGRTICANYFSEFLNKHTIIFSKKSKSVC